MLKTRIRAVRVIKNDSNGNAINLTVIETTNNKPAIVRRAKEFLQDLKNSFLIDDNVVSLSHPQVRKAIKGLRGGTLEGDIAYSKKGDKWIVTETSLAVTDPTHPKYGSVSIGDALEVEKDGARVVDGFLELEQSMQFQALQANADAYANVMASVAGVFDVEDESTTGNTSTEEVFDEIPEDLLQNATTGEPTEEEVEEEVEEEELVE